MKIWWVSSLGPLWKDNTIRWAKTCLSVPSKPEGGSLPITLWAPIHALPPSPRGRETRFSDRQGHQWRKVCSKKQGENTQPGIEWTRPGLLGLVKTHLQQEPGAFWHELQGHHGHSGRQSTDDDKHSPAVEVIIGSHAEAPACKEADLWNRLFSTADKMEEPALTLTPAFQPCWKKNADSLFCTRAYQSGIWAGSLHFNKPWALGLPDIYRFLYKYIIGKQQPQSNMGVHAYHLSI